jgi:hypothetical protein
VKAFKAGKIGEDSLKDCIQTSIGEAMSKMSKITIGIEIGITIGILAAVATSIATPALAQTPHYGGYYDAYPNPGLPYGYSNLPAATGGGSLGYNYEVLHDTGE